jgi:hypothetical protein
MLSDLATPDKVMAALAGKLSPNNCARSSIIRVGPFVCDGLPESCVVMVIGENPVVDLGRLKSCEADIETEVKIECIALAKRAWQRALGQASFRALGAISDGHRLYLDHQVRMR